MAKYKRFPYHDKRNNSLQRYKIAHIASNYDNYWKILAKSQSFFIIYLSVINLVKAN